MRDSKEYVVLNSVTPTAIVSSTNATPIVITATAHGLSNGDLVFVFGHATNTAANGIYKVANRAADTFELTDRYTGTNIAGNGVGGATGLVCAAPKIVACEDFRNAVVHLNTASSGNMTVRAAASLGLNLGDEATGHGDTPNFGATQSDTNPYSYVAMINLEDGAQVEGDTGVVASGTDIFRMYEVNTNGLKYLTLFPTSWTAGAITVKVKLFNNQ